MHILLQTATKSSALNPHPPAKQTGPDHGTTLCIIVEQATSYPQQYPKIKSYPVFGYKTKAQSPTSLEAS
jgi:hypothetical protein